MIIYSLQEFYSNLVKGVPIIAIDYGMKKTGVAISDHYWSFAMPLKQLHIIDEDKKISALIDIILTQKACAIVIGLPINMCGTETEQTAIVRNFTKKIATKLDLPIFLQDERLTSQTADSFLKSFGLKRKIRNANDDAVAASIILQDTMDAFKDVFKK